MVNDTSQKRLLAELQAMVQAHRRAFKQERPFLRAMGLVLGEVFNFGRHTVTQDLLTLGMNTGDWSGWYRLFSRERFEEEQLSHCLLEETWKQVKAEELYCVALDSTVLHCSSLKMPGTSWLRDSRFCAFRPGINRGQRFVHAAWLPPLEEGYSRAIPIRFLPALPPKAVAVSVPVRTEWETAGLVCGWLRYCLPTSTPRAGYRSWGLCSGPPTPARWWPGAKRWSFTTLWRSYRSELWNQPEFRTLCSTPLNDWWNIPSWLIGLSNSVPAASRI